MMTEWIDTHITLYQEAKEAAIDPQELILVQVIEAEDNSLSYVRANQSLVLERAQKEDAGILEEYKWIPKDVIYKYEEVKSRMSKTAQPVQLALSLSNVGS